MKKVYSLITASVLFFTSHSQTWNWGRHVGRISPHAEKTVIKTNAAGELFACGTFYDSAIVGDTVLHTPTTDTWYRGNYVGRLTANYQRIWAQNIKGQNTVLYDLSVDQNNNTYVLGRYAIDLVLSDTSITDPGGNYIVAFDPAGKRKWVKLYPNSSNYGNFIKNDKNNDLVYVSYNYNTNLVTVRKISPTNGSDTWIKNFTSETTSISGLDFNSQNHIYFSGQFGGNTFNIDGNNYYQDTGYLSSSYLAKLDAAGNLMGAEVIPGAYSAQFGIDNQDNIYMIGEYSEKMKIRQVSFTTDTCVPNNCAEYFMAKLNTGGTASWARKIHDELMLQNSIAVMPGGEFYYSGSFHNDSITFDSITLTEQENRAAVFVFKFNTNGIAQWGQKDEGDYLNDQFSLDLAAANKSVYLCGNFHNYSGHTWFGNDTMPGTGFYTHFFLARLTDNQTGTGIATNHNTTVAFSIYPNPSEGIVAVHFNKLPVDTYINVYDLLGTKVISHIEADKPNIELDMRSQQPGAYFVEITDGEKSSVRKVVKR